METRDCIYHASNAKDRIIICKKQIYELEAFAKTHGKQIVHIFIDNTLSQGRKVEYKNYIQSAGIYDSVTVKNLYFINKWTAKAISDVSYIAATGSNVISFDTGEISVKKADCGFFEEYKKVLIYHSKVQKSDELRMETVVDILKLYIKENTNWEIIDIVTDEADKKSVESQPNLWELDVSEYDLIVVQSCSKIDLTSIRFERWCRTHAVDIFSMTEGIVRWNGVGYHEQQS